VLAQVYASSGRLCANEADSLQIRMSSRTLRSNVGQKIDRMHAIFGQPLHERIELITLGAHRHSRPDGPNKVTIGATGCESNHGRSGLLNDFLPLDLQLGFPSGPSVAGFHGWLSVGAGARFAPQPPPALAFMGRLGIKTLVGLRWFFARRGVLRAPAGFATPFLFRPVLRYGTQGVVEPLLVFGQLEQRARGEIFVLRSFRAAKRLEQAQLDTRTRMATTSKLSR